MMHSEDITFDQLIGITSSPLRNMLNVILQVDEAYNDLLEIKAGRGAAVWARALFSLADTGQRLLIVDATAKTIAGPTGYALFNLFNAGQSVITTGFTNAGNNGTFEITAKTVDVLTLANSSGLVDETGGGDERAEIAATQTQIDQTNDIVDGMVAAKEVIDAARNVAVTTAERRDLMRRIS